MGLRATVASAVKAAITAAGDIPESATYRYYTSENPPYQPEEGYVFNPYEDFTLTMLFASYLEKEIDNSVILRTDMRCVIVATEFTDNSITPKISDKIIKDSEAWEIINIFLDPTESVYILQLRRP